MKRGFLKMVCGLLNLVLASSTWFMKSSTWFCQSFYELSDSKTFPHEKCNQLLPQKIDLSAFKGFILLNSLKNRKFHW